MRDEKYVVIDDDPTGTQAVQDVPVFLRWRPDELAATLEASPSIHLMTNARALNAEGAEEITFDAASTARRALPDARLLLRGDSTLRGHLLPEYRGVVRAAYPGRSPVLMLVPALPAAGRVTVAGIHYADSVPVHETAYARDGVFSYGTSRLLKWAEERTDGLLPAEGGIEVPLEALRADHGSALLDALHDAATREHAVVVPDVESPTDLELIAEGARRAYAVGLPLLVRTAPAFAGVLTGSSAREPAPAPTARDGLLVVCGSYVERTTRQLESLYEARGIAPVEVDLGALLGTEAAATDAIARAARAVDDRLACDGLAVLATPRSRPPATQSLDAGQRVAAGLARVLPAVAHLPSVILAKGGITSHVMLRDGLGCDRAHVVGPVATGVALWRASVGERTLDYLVFPGNVGDDGHLAAVVSLVMGG
jgi:uncharacterized protein YgbK (DUF1537 family)